MSAPLRSILDRAKELLDHGDLTEAGLPMGARIGLETRLRELTDALEPCPRDRIRSILFSLEDMVGRADADATLARQSIERDIDDLADVPVWALDHAARAYRRADIGDGKWRPTAGQLRAAAQAKIEAIAAEQYKIQLVLRAKLPPPTKPPSDEDRKRGADLLRQAADAFVLGDRELEKARGFKAPAEESPEAIADRRDARGIVDQRERDIIREHHEAKLKTLQAQYSSAPIAVSAELRASNDVRTRLIDGAEDVA